MEPLRKKKEGEAVVQIANVEAESGSTRQKKALQQVSKYHEDICNHFMLWWTWSEESWDQTKMEWMRTSKDQVLNLFGNFVFNIFIS